MGSIEYDKPDSNSLASGNIKNKVNAILKNNGWNLCIEVKQNKASQTSKQIYNKGNKVISIDTYIEPNVDSISMSMEY